MHWRLGCAAATIAVYAAAPAAQAPVSDWAERAITRLAIETASDAQVEPAEMVMMGRVVVGVYDRFRLAALAARAAMLAGQPMNPESPPASLSEVRTIVIAFSGSPLPDQIPAQSIEISTRDRKLVKRIAILKSAEIAAALPGVRIPGSAMVAAFAVASLKPGDRIRLQSAATSMSIGRAVGGAPQVVAGPSDLSVNFSLPEEKVKPSPDVPAGTTLPPGGVDVKIEGLLDLGGRVRYARVLDGPANLHQAALDAVAKWIYTPAKMWTSPVPLVMQAVVQFR